MFIQHYITFSMHKHTSVSTIALLSACINMCSVSKTTSVLITRQFVYSQFTLQGDATKHIRSY